MTTTTEKQVFDKTAMGKLEVVVTRRERYTVEHYTEGRARGLLRGLRLEDNRRRLAERDPRLQDLTFRTR